MKRVGLIAITAVFALSAGDAVGAPVRMGVVIKPLDNSFFLALYEGARAEAERRDARATFRSVGAFSDVAGQAVQLRRLIAARHQCYVVNPINGTNLIGALRGVRRPIINVDSPIDRAAARRAGVRVRSYIGTDDAAAGRLAGAHMAALLRGGEVAVLSGPVGNVNSELRMQGFERGLRGSRVRIAARVDAGYDRTRAQVAAARVLREHPRLAGFFAVNDLMALGIADALRAAGRTGRARVIGLDGIAAALDAVRAGSLSATVSQYPYVMGQMAVEACVAAARGARLPARVDAPVALITRANIGRAIAAFPRPFGAYDDPFARLIGG